MGGVDEAAQEGSGWGGPRTQSGHWRRDGRPRGPEGWEGSDVPGEFPGEGGGEGWGGESVRHCTTGRRTEK